jgi:hypothetical protein
MQSQENMDMEDSGDEDDEAGDYVPDLNEIKEDNDGDFQVPTFMPSKGVPMPADHGI